MSDWYDEQARRLIPSILFESHPELADELNASIASALNKLMSDLNDELWTLSVQNARLRRDYDGLLTSWAEIKALRDAMSAENARLREALTPFVALADARDAIYRRRGGNPDSFPDTHPSYDINADKRDLPMGIWRKAREIIKQKSGEL